MTSHHLEEAHESIAMHSEQQLSGRCQLIATVQLLTTLKRYPRLVIGIMIGSHIVIGGTP